MLLVCKIRMLGCASEGMQCTLGTPSPGCMTYWRRHTLYSFTYKGKFSGPQKRTSWSGNLRFLLCGNKKTDWWPNWVSNGTVKVKTRFMKQVKCPDCGKIYYEDLLSCPHCGCTNNEYSQQTHGKTNGDAPKSPTNKSAANTSKTCKECGHPLDDNAQICPNCGCPTENASASAFMDDTVLNEGKSTEAESTISVLCRIVWVKTLFGNTKF